MKLLSIYKWKCNFQKKGFSLSFCDFPIRIAIAEFDQNENQTRFAYIILCGSSETCNKSSKLIQPPFMPSNHLIVKPSRCLFRIIWPNSKQFTIDSITSILWKFAHLFEHISKYSYLFFIQNEWMFEKFRIKIIIKNSHWKGRYFSSERKTSWLKENYVSYKIES